MSVEDVHLVGSNRVIVVEDGFIFTFNRVLENGQVLCQVMLVEISLEDVLEKADIKTWFHTVEI